MNFEVEEWDRWHAAFLANSKMREENNIKEIYVGHELQNKNKVHVIYDTPAPEDWTFQKYNVKGDEIYELLKKNKAKCVNVPYKFNRAVLFNSDYFHETDNINFKDEYEGRRINITYLFGDRLFKKN